MQPKCISLCLYKLTRVAITALFLLGLAVSTAGCARFTLASSSEKNAPRIEIPYILGDDTGDLTQALYRAVSAKTRFQVGSDCRYKLIVKILDSKDESLSYRFKNHHPDAKLVGCESRANLLASCEIIDTTTRKCVRGPGFIKAAIDYDYHHDAKSNKLNRLSLGQLEDLDADREVLPIPLNRDMSEKIALWLQQQQDLMPL